MGSLSLVLRSNVAFQLRRRRHCQVEVKRPVIGSVVVVYEKGNPSPGAKWFWTYIENRPGIANSALVKVRRDPATCGIAPSKTFRFSVSSLNP